MKLTVLLIFSGLMTVSASIYSQSTKLNLELDRVSILELFKQIESQSEFVFIYKNEVIDVNRKVDVKANALTVDQILDEVFKDLGLKYEIIKKQIIVTAEQSVPTTKPEKTIQNELQKPNKKQLKGKVTDANGGPLPGTTVVVKGTKDGCITDVEGNFSIDVALDATTLVFSFIGMKSQEIAIGDLTSFNVVLEEDTYSLDEFVTVGYGTKKRRELIGSVAKVEGKDLGNPAFSDFVQSLQGRATGVSISGTQIRIRGVGSISNSSDPLYVVDGVITSNALDLINKNDIESIDIQKDAAATSIYGSRGSNGVIMITTKSGKGAKQNSFNIDYTGGIEQYASDWYPYANNQDYLAVMTKTYANSKETFHPVDPYMGIFPDMKDSVSWDVANITNIDRRKLITRNKNFVAIPYSGRYHDISISGNTLGNNSNTIYSLNYRNSEGMNIGSSNQRVILKLGTNATPIKSDLLDVNLSMNSSLVYSEGTEGAYRKDWLPYWPTYDAASTTGYWNVANNPMATADKNYVDNFSKNFRALGILGLELLTPWFKGFSLKGSANWDYSNYYNSNWSNAVMTPSFNRSDQVTASDYKGNKYNVLLNATANYKKTFDSHKIDFVGGIEHQTVYGDKIGIAAHDFTSLYHEIGDITDPANQVGSASSKNYTGEEYILAYLARLSYSFKGKYYADGSFRRDGFSKFSKDRRWGMFSSVGIGWILTEEEFMKDINWLNMLKFRGSYGQTGNSQLNISNPSVNLYDTRPGYGSYPNQYLSIPSIRLTSIGNSKAGWETSTKTDVGIDYGLLENRINGSLAYFMNDIDGLLLKTNLPESAGIYDGNVIWSNIGSMRNKGLEFSINAVPIRTAHFSWEVSFNHTAISNEVTGLTPEVDIKGTGYSDGNTMTKKGLPISTYFLPEWAGVDPDTGCPMYWGRDSEIYSATGETVKTDKRLFASSSAAEDNRIIQDGKSAMPKWFGGIFNTIRYKDFDLAINITYSGGNYLLDNNQINYISTGWENVAVDRLSNSWEQPGDLKKYPQMTKFNKYFVDADGKTSANSTAAYNGFDTRNLFKADYLKLREITLGYNVSKLLSKKVGTEGVRIFGTVTNVMTWSDVPANTDPEVTFGSNTGGLYSQTNPVSRIYSLGVSVKF